MRPHPSSVLRRFSPVKWQCCVVCSSSLVVPSNEPGPDFADYPYDTVPNKVDQLFRAQRHHDRRQNDVSRACMALRMHNKSLSVSDGRWGGPAGRGVTQQTLFLPSMLGVHNILVDARKHPPLRALLSQSRRTQACAEAFLVNSPSRAAHTGRD